ncbi:MAG: MFS transporter [Haloferacaceae archaeon]
MSGHAETAEATSEATYASLLTDPRLLIILSISVSGTMGPNVASPALPAMAGSLAVTDARVGLVMTAYTLPAMVFVPLTGALADMYGRRTVILPSLVAFGLAGTAIAFVGSVTGPGGVVPLSPFQAILALRAVQGAGVAGFMSLTVTLLGDLYAGGAGTTAQGIRVGANGLSGILVPLAAGALAGIAWNAPFLIYGLALAFAVVAFVALPETTGGIDDGTGVLDTLASYGRSLRVEMADIQTGVLISGGFARDFVRYAVITFVPLFAVRVLGASLAEAGAVLAVRGVAAIVVSPTAGELTGRYDHRHALLLALALTAGSVALFPAAPSIPLLGALLLVYSVGDALFSPVIKDAVTDAARDEYRSGVVGGMQLLKYAAQTASPAVFGVVLAVSGFDTLFWGAALVSGLYAAAVFGLLGSATERSTKG